MRRACLSFFAILIMLSALSVAAQETVPAPAPASTQFPKIQSALDDGFYVLAEQLSRGVLRSEPKKEAEYEAVLLLSHALWGQKRYSEMLTTLINYDDDPGIVYWRARARFELKQYNAALKILAEADETMGESRYAPAAMRLKAHIELITGNPDQAEKTCRQFASVFPDHPECLENQFDLAEILERQERAEDAQVVYEKLAASENKRAAQRAELKLGHLLYTQGGAENIDAARTILSRLAANEEANLRYRIDAYVDLAALEEQSGNQVDAVAAMRAGIALSPDALQRVPLKLALARMLSRNNDTKGSLKLLEECRAEAPNQVIAAELQLEKANVLLQAERFDEADEAYQVYLDVADDPGGLAKAHFGKGLAVWALERYIEAAGLFDKVLKDPGGEVFRAEALFKSGDANYKAERYEIAEERYSAFLIDFPDHKNIPDALYQLGLCQAQIGRRAEALATFGKLESEYASSPVAEKAALRTADVLMAGQEWQAALDKYTLIGQTYTNRAVAAASKHQQGLLLYRLGKYREAEAAFDAVIIDFPESEFVPQASYMRGFCLYLQGRVDKAVQTCEDFVKAYPDSEWTPEVIFWLAEQYFNKGDYMQAQPLFLRIAGEFEGHRLASRALYWSGRCEAAQSSYVKAIENYSAVAKNYPDSDVLPQTRFAQGDALTELGEFSRAILAFEEIIKNYPESYLVNAAWGRKGDCQFSLAAENPARYAEAMNSYQAILDRPSAPAALKLQAEYKIGRCFEKTNVPDKAFLRYMNVVYTFINENVERSPYGVMWFTRSAFGAATLKERERAWLEAVKVYEQVVETGVPAAEEAAKRIEKIKTENWLLFQKAEEMDNVGIDG